MTKKGQSHDKHVTRDWRTALKNAGVRHRQAYQLRHAFASLCLQNGAQPTWMAKTLGHLSPQITFKHYARVIDNNSSINEQLIEQYLKDRQHTHKQDHITKEHTIA
ncbi:MAG: tyrosine-type recombinase/integrase [Candidatus Obscuribacter sp.]|nr:tyrosine-type recombinase/integrase [Candidatus Obscuribacter sp.]